MPVTRSALGSKTTRESPRVRACDVDIIDRCLARVLVWNRRRHFGFLRLLPELANSRDVFVHRSTVVDAPAGVIEVEVRLQPNGRLRATRVRLA